MSVYREPSRALRRHVRRRPIPMRPVGVVDGAADAVLGLAVSTLLLLGVAMLVALFLTEHP